MLSKSLLKIRSTFAGAFRPKSIILAAALVGATVAQATNPPDPSASWKWVASWTTGAQGVLSRQPGSPSPDLEFAFPSYTVGAQEQTFRIIIKPDLWENEARLRLTNLFGYVTRSATIPIVGESIHILLPTIIYSNHTVHLIPFCW